MLDFGQVHAQLTTLTPALRAWEQARVTRGQEAVARYRQLAAGPDQPDRAEEERVEDAATASDLRPQEPLDHCPTLTPWLTPHTVVATDGSQIIPSAHDPVPFALLNVGRVRLAYGQARLPQLDTVAQVLPPDLSSPTAADWAWQRHGREWQELAHLAVQAVGEWPILALVDGALIPWGVDLAHLPSQLAPHLAIYDQLRAAQVAIAGYISHSHSRDVLHWLATQAPDLDLDGLRDVDLWWHLLAPGQRSPLWRSCHPQVATHGPHQPQVCYLHMGCEIARLEFPTWLAADPIWLDQSLRIILSQGQRGQGYPIALAEAHHLAVVQGGDRQAFFDLLADQHQAQGWPRPRPSPKAQTKRQGIG